MIKKRRISVPVSDDLRHELEQASATTGASVASLLEDLIQSGREKSAVAEQLAELRSIFQTHPADRHHETENAHQTAELLHQILTKIEQLPTQKQPAEQGIFLKPTAFLHLFQEVYFSAFLSTSLAAEMAPGAARQPVGIHLQNARTKAKAAVQQFLDLETRK